MAALTAPRFTNPYGGLGTAKPARYGPYPMNAATIVYVGAIVCIDTSNSGLATNGATSTTLVPVGVAAATFENVVQASTDQYLDFDSQAKATGTLGNSSGLAIDVSQGVYPFFNDPANLLANTNIGSSVYILDNQTVSSSSAGKSKLGVMVLLDAGTGLVWVSIDPFAGRP